MKFKLVPCCFAIIAFGNVNNAQANTSFDGSWNVQIVMDRGNCDPINQLVVDIREGILQYAGDSTVSINGQVVTDGLVRVRLIHGNHKATGSGRLSASSGAGTWHGTGLASSCSGRWSAERH